MIDILNEERTKTLSNLNKVHAYATEKEIEKCFNYFNFSEKHFYDGNICCKNRFCIGCQKKRQILWYFNTIHELKKLNKDFVFASFEIEETNKLINSIDILQNSFHSMTNKSSKSSKAFHYLFAGGIHSLSISYDENKKLWNSKIDCILIRNNANTKFDDKFLFEFLCEAWHSANCSARQLISKQWGCVKLNNDGNIYNYCSWLCNNLISHIKITNSMNKSTIITELLDALKNRHIIQPFGILKTHDKIDDFIHYNRSKTEEFIKNNYKKDISLCDYNDLEISNEPIKYLFSQQREPTNE